MSRARCLQCGRSFEPEGPLDVTCSSECAAVLAYKHVRPKRAGRSQLDLVKSKLEERRLSNCQHCGAKLYVERKNQRYCKPPRGCKQAAYRARVTFRASSEGRDTRDHQNREYAPTNTGCPDPRNVTPEAGKGG